MEFIQQQINIYIKIMKKYILLLSLVLGSIISKAQTWVPVGNTLQRSVDGTGFKYRFSLGSPGFYNITDSIRLGGKTYTPGYGMSLVGQQFRVDTSLIASKIALNTKIIGIQRIIDTEIKTNLRSNLFINRKDKRQPWLFIGDSITEGTATNDFTKDNWASIIRRVFQSYFGISDYGFQNFNPYLNQSTINTFMKYTISGFNSANQYAGSFDGRFYGGIALGSVTSGDYVEFTYTGKDFSIVYTNNSADGSVANMTVDGVSVANIDTKLEGDTTQMPIKNPYGAFYTQNVASYGFHTVRITNTENKSLTLSGVQFANQATEFNRPLLNNVGRSSIALTDLSDGIIDYYCSTGSIVLSLGVNDDQQGTDPVVFTAKLERFINNIKNNKGQIIVQDFIFNKTRLQSVYKNIMWTLCRENNITYIDYNKLWIGDAENNIKYGLVDPDGIHPSTDGMREIANTIYSYMPINSQNNILRTLDIGQIGASTTGSAQKWNDLYISTPVVSPTVLGLLAADGTTTIKNASNSSVKNFLQTSFQNTTDVNATSTNAITVPFVNFPQKTGTNAFGIGNDATSQFFVYDGTIGAYRLTIANSGYVGINNSSPSETLDVSGNIKSSSLAGSGDRLIKASTSGVISPSNLISDFVTTNTVQTITAVAKTFTGSVNFQNISATGIEANVLSLAQKSVAADANYSVVESDYTVLVQGGTVNATITLPNSAIGKMYIIKRVNGGTNTITISAASIDGVATKTLILDYSGVVLQSAGAGQYYIIGSF